MCITTDYNLQVGTEILARIFIGADSCELKGELAWVTENRQDGNFRIGVELESISDEFKEIYQNMIKKFSPPEKEKKSFSDLNLVHKV